MEHVEYEKRRREALKKYEDFKEITLKQLDFTHSLEFDKLPNSEKFFHQTKYTYMHGYLNCLRVELDNIISEEKEIF